MIWFPYKSAGKIEWQQERQPIDVDKLFDGSFTFLQIAKLQRIFGFKVDVKASFKQPIKH